MFLSTLDWPSLSAPMNTMLKRAFTLIELLVVIAIIAILAAILFPVFAQAKSAAKKTASLSNQKQISLGAIMYGADYDDNIPVLLNGNWDGLSAANGNGPNRTKTWTENLQPYLKNWQLLADPTRGDALGIFNGGSSDTGITSHRNRNRFPMFGFNYLFLSPWPDCNISESKSFTQAEEPSGTVMFTQSQLFTQETTRGYVMVNAPGMWPIISPHPTYCIIYDGSVGSGNWSGNNPTAPRKITSSTYLTSEGSNVGWLDGSAKYLKDGALAAGTDYGSAVKTNAAEGAVITDKSRYLWNLDSNYYGG